MQQYLDEINKIKEKVIYLFNRFPDTINSDESLINFYSSFWGKPDVKTISSISRASRFLRSKYPERYHRTGKALENSKLKEKAFKEYYGNKR